MSHILTNTGTLLKLDEIRVAYIKEITEWDGSKHKPTGVWRGHYSFGKDNAWNTGDLSKHDAELWISEIANATKGKSMLSDISKDVKGFITDNRQIIYWMALIFLLDHFFFAGAFRERLKGLAEKMLGKVEKQIEAK